MIKQNDTQLLPAINSYGCRFRCLQAIAEITVGRALSYADILASYQTFRFKPSVMNANCLCGSQEHKIIDEAFCRLSSEFTGRQIGRMQDGQPLGWNNRRHIIFDFMIVHWATSGPDGHFTLADDNGAEIFDPWCYCAGRGLKKLYIQRQLLYAVWEKK